MAASLMMREESLGHTHVAFKPKNKEKIENNFRGYGPFALSRVGTEVYIP
jgi:hypothetical protein